MSGALALAMAAAGAVALATAPPAGAQPTPARTADAAFVGKAIDGATTVGELAKVAAAQAADARVKAYAARLVEEQAAIADALRALAEARGIELPPVSAALQRDVADLSRRAGADFDRAFVAVMASAHDTAVGLFEGEAADGRDDEVKEWAAKQLPVLREQQARVRALRPGGGS